MRVKKVARRGVSRKYAAGNYSRGVLQGAYQNRWNWFAFNVHVANARRRERATHAAQQN